MAIHDLKTMIGFQNSTDNKVQVIMCGDNGHLETTGTILINSYNNLAAAKQLIENGAEINASSLIDVDTNNYPWCVSNIGMKIFTVSKYLLEHNFRYKYLYMFSEADNKWYISSNDNPTFRSLASEL